MSLNAYMAGTLVRTSATFTTVAGTATNPTTTTLKYRSGSGSVTTVVYPSAPIVNDSAGAFHADLDSTGWAGPGNLLWEAEWIGTGAVQAIASDSWLITPPLL